MYSEEIEEGVRRSVCRARPASYPRPARGVGLITVIACISFFSLGGLVGVTGPAIPSLTVHLGCRDETQLGSAFTCRGAGYLTGAVLASVLDTRCSKGKHLVVVMGSLLAGLATLGIVWTHVFSGFLVLMVLQGLGLGCVDTAANAVVLELWGGSPHVEPLMQAMHACFGIGAVASPAAVGALGYVLAFRLWASIALLPLFLWAGGLMMAGTGRTGDGEVLWGEATLPLLRDGAHHSEEGREEEPGSSRKERETLPRPFRDREAGLGRPTSVPSTVLAHAQAASPKPSIAPPASSPLASLPKSLQAGVSFFLLIYVGIEVGYGGWIATVLLRQGLTQSLPVASYSVSMFWGAITLGRLLAIPLATCLPPVPSLLLQLGLSTLGAICLLTFAFQTLWTAAVASVVFGLGLSSIFPTVMLLPEALGYQVTMWSTSTFLVGACLGEGIIPMGIGWLMGSKGIGTGSFAWAMAAACLALWVLAGCFFSRWRVRAGTGCPPGRGGGEGGGQARMGEDIETVPGPA
ncbi:sodium-dependent glucose transporter 1 [Nannochloropsis gaditana]|uniref:Sodium-dependent glucose transporter 1 n=1 Tax=Nannochloropsis gaditana TaxID=72520 RepID=W7TVG0_9STRA|nr:sodium-dependent glucose transporter 1 [Nannochloropsis gaditana]